MIHATLVVVVLLVGWELGKGKLESIPLGLKDHLKKKAKH
jgi:hypothetical protein